MSFLGRKSKQIGQLKNIEKNPAKLAKCFAARIAEVLNLDESFDIRRAMAHKIEQVSLLFI